MLNYFGIFFYTATVGNMTIPNWLLYVIIGFITILLILMISYFFARSQKKQREKLQKNIDDLDADRNKLLASSLESSLAKIRTFEQTARVAQKYKAWLTSWETIRTTLSKEVPNNLIEIEDLLERNKFKAVPEEIQKQRTKITAEKTKITAIENEVKTFISNEENIHKNFEQVKDALKQVAQLYYANRSSLEPYTKELQTQIEVLDKGLYNILDIMDTEDKKDVELKLSGLKDKILAKYAIIKELPNAIALNSKVLQPQIDILNKAYHEMVEQDFLFQGLNLDRRIEKLQERIKDLQQNIDKFELLNIESEGIHIRKQIEEIHQILVNEKAAKDDVILMLENLNQKMNRLRFDKEDFLDIWNKLLKRYEVTKEQVAKVDAFSAQVLSAETKMILFNNQFEKNQEAYVVFIDDLKNFDQQLNELHYTLGKLNKVVDTIKEDEIYIKAQFKQLKYMHHRSKRKISQLPADLLPDEYLLKNDEAVFSLKEIEDNLELDILDVKHLTELIETAQHLSIRFYKDTNMLIKAAAFAEKAIIYSNRYRFDRDVQRHLAKAEYLYNQGEYTEALDVSLSTLETVEPGIYETLLQAYENAVQKETN